MISFQCFKLLVCSILQLCSEDLLCLECGLSGRDAPRIAVGGVEAKVGEFPWQAMLCGTKGNVFCGGVMISKCSVLTAAHCVTGADPRSQFDTRNSSSLKVCLGRTRGDCNVGFYNDNKEKQKEQIQCFNAHRILVHPEYIHNDTTLEHDIAMIQLKTNECLQCRSASVRPVCLPKKKRDKNYISVGAQAWVTGWGEIETGRGITGTLRKAKTKLVGHSKCKSYFGRSKNPAIIKEDQICAKDDVGPCQGDSGGPLMVQNDEFENRYILVGLVSWGRGCGTKGSYGVYADIEHHLDWIYDNWN